MATTHTSEARPTTSLTGEARPSTSHTGELRGIGGSTWDEHTETWDETATLVEPDMTWDSSGNVITTLHTAEARP